MAKVGVILLLSLAVLALVAAVFRIRGLQIALMLIAYFSVYLVGVLVVTPLAAIAAGVAAFGVMCWQWPQRCTKGLREALEGIPFFRKNVCRFGVIAQFTRTAKKSYRPTTCQ